jgi:hypothetical protein
MEMFCIQSVVVDFITLVKMKMPEVKLCACNLRLGGTRVS